MQNIIYISDDEVGSTDYYTPPTSSVRSTRQRTRGGQNEDPPMYDGKYHPIDDYLYPKRAAKMKSKYTHTGLEMREEEATNSDAGSESDVESLQLESGSKSEVEEFVPETKSLKGKGKKGERSPARRSARTATQPYSIYDMKHHPQDDYLIDLGVLNKRKRCQVSTDGDDEDNEAGSTQRKKGKTTHPTSRPEISRPRAESTASSSADSTFDAQVRNALFNSLFREEPKPIEDSPGEEFYPHRFYGMSSNGKSHRNPPFTIYKDPMVSPVDTMRDTQSGPTRYSFDYPKENGDQEEDVGGRTTVHPPSTVLFAEMDEKIEEELKHNYFSQSLLDGQLLTLAGGDEMDVEE